MPNYFSDNFKDSVNDALLCLHDSFKREIKLYFDVPVDSAPADVNNNPLFGRKSNPAPTPRKTRSTDTINARIKYIGTQGEDFMNFGGTVIVKSEGLIRIKVKKEYESKVERAASFEVDNQLFTLNSDKKKIGPWPDDAENEDFSMYYLQRTD